MKALLVVVLLVLMATPAQAVPEGPAFPSVEWTAREAANYALTLESPVELAADPAFGPRLLEQTAANALAFAQRQVTDPEFHEETNACASYAGPCGGDPRLYPGADPFYDTATLVQVEFADRGGARLAGTVWQPEGATGPLPGIVFMNGSIGAAQAAYWNYVHAFVRAGYQVLTFDPRGQGRSDTLTPSLVPGSNVNPQAFPDDLVDAIDFFHSTPATPYPHAATPAGTAFNPLHASLDRGRLGLVGHSLGAMAVTLVQGYDPWPGLVDAGNPVDAVVGLDNLGLTVTGSEQVPSLAGIPLDENAVTAAVDAIAGLGDQVRAITPRVPAMGQAGDYFVAPVPFLTPPDPVAKQADGYARWRAAGVPTAQVQIRGATHHDFSRIPGAPNRSYSIGSAMSEHYALAWLDRWVKAPGQKGYADADARLLADPAYRSEMSVYYRTSRSFSDRSGRDRSCQDVRAGCALLEAPSPSASAAPVPAAEPAPGSTPPAEALAPAGSSLAATGGSASAGLAALVLLGGAAVARRRPAQGRRQHPGHQAADDRHARPERRSRLSRHLPAPLWGTPSG